MSKLIYRDSGVLALRYFNICDIIETNLEGDSKMLKKIRLFLGLAFIGVATTIGVLHFTVLGGNLFITLFLMGLSLFLACFYFYYVGAKSTPAFLLAVATPERRPWFYIHIPSFPVYHDPEPLPYVEVPRLRNLPRLASPEK